MNSGLQRYVLGALGTGLFWACLFATTRLQAVEAALGRQLERMQPEAVCLALEDMAARWRVVVRGGNARAMPPLAPAYPMPPGSASTTWDSA